MDLAKHSPSSFTNNIIEESTNQQQNKSKVGFWWEE